MSSALLASRPTAQAASTGWATTTRLTFEVTRGGVFGKAPEAAIRAAMGRALAERVCPYAAADTLPCAQCLMQAECPFPRVFKPVARASAPSAPAPYVLSYHGPDPLWSGGAFCLDLTVVGRQRPSEGELQRALVDAFTGGVGRDGARIQARLIGAQTLAPLSLPTTERLEVICRTPIAAKRNALRAGWSDDTFQALIADRLGALTRAYGRDGCPEPPGTALRTAHPQLEIVARHGFSARQARGIQARGWIGRFELVGWQAWRDVLPVIARIGVGRHTAWGNGQLHFEGIAPRRQKGRR